MLKHAIDWFHWHPEIFAIAIGLSIVTMLASIVLVPVLIVRMPADYFSRARTARGDWSTVHPLLRIAVIAAKNLLGAILLMAGLLMLFTPGQGVLTVLAGLALTDIPGKRRLEVWIVSRPPVFTAINKLRARFGHTALEMPAL